MKQRQTLCKAERGSPEKWEQKKRERERKPGEMGEEEEVKGEEEKEKGKKEAEKLIYCYSTC